MAKKNKSGERAELILRIWTHEGKLPEDLTDAFEQHTKHVTGMLAQGYIAGEICDDRFNGWWEIKKS
jgi:hypothetical protein